MGGLVVDGLPQDRANRIVKRSVEAGVNYFDVAPTYGNAEQKLGPALEPYREEVFLACKTHHRDAEGAREDLENSLRRLRTDRFDLYQFHGVSDMEDVEKILSPGGAGEVFRKARREGKVRFLGFSAHAEKPAIELIDRFECDSVLFPVNFVCVGQGEFGPRVLKHARKNDVAPLAIKSMAYTRRGENQEKEYPDCWYVPVSEKEQARTALRFTLSEGVISAIPPAEEELYLMALELAREGLPTLPEDEREQLLASTEDLKPLFSA